MIVFSTADIGGAERSLTRMALSGEPGVEYGIATLGGEGPLAQWLRSVGVAPVVLGADGAGFVSRVLRLARRLREDGVDIVYVCGLRASMALRLLKPLLPRGAKLVHAVRWNPDSGTRLDVAFRFTERFTRFLVDGWITNSAAASQTLVLRCDVPRSRVHVIYNGVPELPARPQPLKQRPLEVVTLANLSPRKGHLEFLEVIEKVHARCPQARFVFAGSDNMDGAVQRAIEARGLACAVECVGFCSDVGTLLERARLFVLPSLWGEGCPTTVLEAFSHGVPVVAHAIDGIPELVDHGRDGLLFTVGARDVMAEGILRLLEDPTAAGAMGAAGRRKVQHHFVLSACAKKHAVAFAELAART